MSTPLPRRKVRGIRFGHLQHGQEIYQLLKDDPLVAQYDFPTFEMKVKEKITHQIKDVPRVIRNLEHYLLANPSCCELFRDIPYVGKQKLARMMRVSRSPPDKRLRDRLLIPLALQQEDDH